MPRCEWVSLADCATRDAQRLAVPSLDHPFGIQTDVGGGPYGL